MQKAILPLRYIGISQPMYGKVSHIGLKAIDFGWNSNYYEQSTVLLAPFDGKVVWKKGSSNTIAFQSNEKVEYADGTVDYMTVITAHDNNAPSVGKTFKQGEIYSHSGTAGGVPLHCHLEVQKGKFQSYTSIKNTSYDGRYNSYIFPNTYIPYEALFIRDDELFTANKANNPYTWNKVGEMSDLIKIVKDENYDYKWSVDGNRYGDKYDITTQNGFGDTKLEEEGWELVLKTNASLFYGWNDNGVIKHFACGLEKSRGVNNQELEMDCVKDYNSCMAIACVGGELYFGSQEWIIKNKLNEAYGAITGMGLILAGKARDDMRKMFEGQFHKLAGRTIIGEDKEGNIMSYSIKGDDNKGGLTGKQAQQKCLELGFYNASMLDGGSSVFRQYEGKYDISTGRKVKNALLLYRKKKTQEPIEPTEPTIDYKAKYEELEKTYNDLNSDYKALESDYKALSVENIELTKKLKQLTTELELVKNDNAVLKDKLKKIKEIVNE